MMSKGKIYKLDVFIPGTKKKVTKVGIIIWKINGTVFKNVYDPQIIILE